MQTNDEQPLGKSTCQKKAAEVQPTNHNSESASNGGSYYVAPSPDTFGKSPMFVDISANRADGPPPTQRDESRLRTRAFAQCFAWTDEYLQSLFRRAANPRRAAAAYASRKIADGLLHCGQFDVQQIVVGSEPLAASGSEPAADADRLAYLLEKRFSGASKSTRVYWPSPRFGRFYGSWVGADSYPSPHKLSHDLLVTSVWLRMLEHSPRLALNDWTPERWLQREHRQGRWKQPIPDALVANGGRVTAIEIGGNYPAAWIRHHIQRFEAAGWAWQLW